MPVALCAGGRWLIGGLAFGLARTRRSSTFLFFCLEIREKCILRRPVPVENLVQYKQLTQRESRHRSYSTAETTDENTLATQVLRKCQKNQNLLRFLQDHQTNAPAETPTSSKQKKNNKKKAPVSNSSASSSPESTPVKKHKAAKKRSRRKGRYKTNSSSSSENSEPSESS